jgi:hypothetical protein
MKKHLAGWCEMLRPFGIFGVLSGLILDKLMCCMVLCCVSFITVVFCSYLLLPRILKCVSDINLSTSVLGNKIDFPVCVAPSALHGLVHPDGETATARGTPTLFYLY